MGNRVVAGIAVLILSSANMIFAQSSFEVTDDNNDGRITKEEFYERIEKANVFDTVDTNLDRQIDEEEFDRLEVAASFLEWDANQDQRLDRREFYNGLYSYLDEDADGSLSIFEWDDSDDQDWFDVYEDPF